jgi:hypothetical protein
MPRERYTMTHNGEQRIWYAFYMVISTTSCFTNESIAKEICDARIPPATKRLMSNYNTPRDEHVDRLYDIKIGRNGEWREFSTNAGSIYRICYYTVKIFKTPSGEDRPLKLDEITQDMVSKYKVHVEYDADYNTIGAIELKRFTVLDP